jgi:Carboxylesterase type B
VGECFILLVSKQARGLFHKAISMSGYTTSISTSDAYKPLKKSSTSTYASSIVVEKILKEQNINEQDIKQIRETLLNLSAEKFFNYYSSRKSYEELPLLTADGVVIPSIGLKNALSKKEYVYNVPTIAGSNRDEVKLWLSTARYFVDLDYSFIGSILNIPKVKIKDEDAFEAFNYYRSSAWQIRGVDVPLRSLYKAGNKDLFAYRYDWDDHRRLIIADFKKIIGAAHATEIPLLAGNSDLVGGYPLSDLIYPPSFSKRYLSKNMIKYWSNFAKKGTPGKSSNKILWSHIFPMMKATHI